MEVCEKYRYNITTIKGYDSSCTNVIDKSSSAHVYCFDVAKAEWKKTEIGGVFFLYERSKSPYYSFMVLNRKRPNMNLREFLSKDMDILVESPYLMIKTKAEDIYSIWFYSCEDCERIAGLMRNLLKNLTEPPNIPELVDPVQTAVTNNTRALLNQFFASVKQNNANQSSHTYSLAELDNAVNEGSKHPNILQLLAQAETVFKQNSDKSAFSQLDVQSAKGDRKNAVLNTFANKPALNNINKRSAMNKRKPADADHSSGDDENTNIMGNVADIKREQSEDEDEMYIQQKAHVQSASNVTTKTNKQFQVSNQPVYITNSSGLPNNPTKDSTNVVSSLQQRMTTSNQLMGLVTPEMLSLVSNYQKTPTDAVASQQNMQKPTAKPKVATTPSNVPSSDEVARLCNNMFQTVLEDNTKTKTDSKHRSRGEGVIQGIQQQQQHQSVQNNNAHDVIGLTRTQLKEALVYLLQDDDFLTKIHSAYSSALQAKLSKCSTT